MEEATIRCIEILEKQLETSMKQTDAAIALVEKIRQSYSERFDELCKLVEKCIGIK